MRRALARVAVLTTLFAAAACGRDEQPTGVPPGAPHRVVAAAYSPGDTVDTYIPLLLPANGPRTVVSARWRSIQDAVARGQTNAALAQVRSLTNYLLTLLDRGVLLDPYGPTVHPTTRGGTRIMIEALFAYVGAPVDPAVDARLDQNTQTVVISNPAERAEARKDETYLVEFPGGTFEQPTVVTVEQLPPNASPLPGFVPGESVFPTWVDISVSPAVERFRAPVRIVLCTREPEDGGPPTSAYPRLRIGHGVDGGTEILPFEDPSGLACAGEDSDGDVGTAPFGRPGDGLLARAGVTLRWLASRTARAVGPVTAYAAHSGVGGVTRLVSPFGAIDPGTSAPSQLDVEPPAATIGVGGTVQLATVLRNAAGDALSGYTVTYESLRPDVATVSPGGLATGVSAGTATVFATATLPGFAPVLGIATITVQASTVGPAFTVRGTLTDAATGLPVPNATMTLRLPHGSPVQTVNGTSGDNGAYRFTVPAGAARRGAGTVQVAAPGYLPATRAFTTPARTRALTRNFRLTAG